MRNKIFKTLAIAFMAVAAIGLTGCFGSDSSSTNNGGGGSTSSSENGGNGSSTVTPESKITAEIADFDYGFVLADGITDDSQISISSTSKPISFDVIESYYMVINYTLTSRADNSGQYLVDTVISFDGVSFIDGNIYTVSGTTLTEKTTIKDPGTGNDNMKLNISYKVPSSKDALKNVMIVVKLSTLKFGESMMKIGFESSDVNLTGDCDGVGKLMVINKVKLAAPVISFNSSTLALEWNHVEHADYYKLIVDNAVVTDTDGKDVYFSVDSYVANGSTLSWDISSYVSGTRYVKIQAFSNSANFEISDYSNEIAIKL